MCSRGLKTVMLSYFLPDIVERCRTINDLISGNDSGVVGNLTKHQLQLCILLSSGFPGCLRDFIPVASQASVGVCGCLLLPGEAINKKLGKIVVQGKDV